MAGRLVDPTTAPQYGMAPYELNCPGGPPIRSTRRAGIIDQPQLVHPPSETWYQSKVDWAEIDESLPSFLPPQGKGSKHRDRFWRKADFDQRPVLARTGLSHS